MEGREEVAAAQGSSSEKCKLQQRRPREAAGAVWPHPDPDLGDPGQDGPWEGWMHMLLFLCRGTTVFSWTPLLFPLQESWSKMSVDCITNVIDFPAQLLFFQL